MTFRYDGVTLGFDLPSKGVDVTARLFFSTESCSDKPDKLVPVEHVNEQSDFGLASIFPQGVTVTFVNTIRGVHGAHRTVPVTSFYDNYVANDKFQPLGRGHFFNPDDPNLGSVIGAITVRKFDFEEKVIHTHAFATNTLRIGDIVDQAVLCDARFTRQTSWLNRMFGNTTTVQFKLLPIYSSSSMPEDPGTNDDFPLPERFRLLSQSTTCAYSLF